MGVGIILASLTSRAIFAPLAIYAVSIPEMIILSMLIMILVAHSKLLV